MSATGNRFPLLLFSMVALTALLAQETAWCASRAKSLPSWSIVDKMIESHFEALPDYKPGDLIVRSEVEALLTKLARQGWRVANGRSILALVPKDDEFLAKRLRSKNGRKFMRQIADYPNAFDRLDRLGRMRRGKKIMEALVRGPDGYKLIEYMTKTGGGRELGKQLSRSPQGKDFNKPTGRIYTEKALRKRLKKSYRAANPSGGDRKTS